MIVFIAVIEETWVDSGGGVVPSFQGGVVGSSVNCALAVRTALLSKAIGAKDVIESVPVRMLNPIRLPDKLTTVRSPEPAHDPIIDGIALSHVCAGAFFRRGTHELD